MDSTVCPFCAVGCRLAPGPDGRAAGREGPANPDGRLCAKGIEAFRAFDESERLTRPRVRRDGELVPVDWPTALDAAVDALGGVRDAHGPDGLAFLGAPHCTTEENYLLQKLARTLGTNDVDNRARACHGLAAGAVRRRLGPPAMTNSLDDLATADLILVVGANPATQQPVAFDGAVRTAANNGATLVHVDPRANETTRTADVHLAPRPGTDALLLSLLCAVVAEAGLVDREFVAARTSGFDTLAGSLAGLDVERGAAVADVDADAVRRVGRAVGEADGVAAVVGTGVETTGLGTTTPDALLNLLLLTGNLGRPGAGMNLFRGLANEQGAVDAGCVPDALPGHQPVTDPAARDRAAEAWGVAPPADPGRPESELLAAFGDDVRGVLVVGENPVVSKRDREWVAERVDGLDALVVADVVETETTERADVVLPASVAVEKRGTVTNLDRQVQRLAPLADPPGVARPDFEILRTLGRRLSPAPFDHDDPADAFAELCRVAPAYEGIDPDGTDGPRRWPDGEAVLYREAFATDDGLAPFVPVDPDATVASGGEGLVLVAGSRAGGFAAAERTDERLHLHEDDAGARAVADGDLVTVVGAVDGDTPVVEATAAVGTAVRPGTAFLHADPADPLVRRGVDRVEVRPADD
jgi:predicted molibdopterin-dependent oxidoreductase YjgC